jgi:tetrahydromethanopterin S-methyltransferase subunit G
MQDPLGPRNDVSERLDRIEARLDEVQQRLANLKTGGGGIGCLGFGLFVLVLLKLSEILELLSK